VKASVWALTSFLQEKSLAPPSSQKICKVQPFKRNGSWNGKGTWVQGAAECAEAVAAAAVVVQTAAAAAVRVPGAVHRADWRIAAAVIVGEQALAAVLVLVHALAQSPVLAALLKRRVAGRRAPVHTLTR